MRCTLVVLVISLVSIRGYIVEPGIRFKPSVGEIWPKPQNQTKSEDYFQIQPDTLQISMEDASCTFLQEAVNRYVKVIETQYEIVLGGDVKFSNKEQKDENDLGSLKILNIILNGTCDNEEYFALGTDESYTLEVNSDPATVSANTIWGALRGLESFSQSIYVAKDLSSLRINKTLVVDYPRFPHRGLLFDTSRHFVPKELLLTNLDAMAYNKMNVFHWHIVDDESFPYVSKKFPDLSAKGAFKPSYIYSVEDVQEVIEYARLRGIRVIPEFDTPAHTRSWGEGQADLLTQCHGSYEGKLGPIDPTNMNNYDFLKELFAEIREVFPDEYVHLGGDELGYECWQSNENIKQFMNDNGLTTYPQLENYYMQKIFDIVNDTNSKPMVWQEVFLNNVKLPADSVVQVWEAAWGIVLYEAVVSGYKALLSSCWYLSDLKSGGDWKDFYLCEPYEAPLLTDELKQRILGGEACMWGEYVNEHNIITRVWPRTSAIAERLWSKISVRDIDDAVARLEEHHCRMNNRGVGAQPPNGPGFCY